MIFINGDRVNRTIQLLEKLKKNASLSNKEYKFMLETAYHLLSSDNDDEYNLGLSIICHVAEAKPGDTFIHQLLFDCIIDREYFCITRCTEETTISTKKILDMGH